MEPDVVLSFNQLDLKRSAVREAIDALLVLVNNQPQLHLESTLLELTAREIGYLEEMHALLEASL